MQNSKIDFLNSFSEAEWKMNGHIKKKVPELSRLFDIFESYVQEGKYIELGCGTGILCRYLELFSEKKIIPHGIDKNREAIKKAKINNKRYKNNFITADYFTYYKKNQLKFSTILIFVMKGENKWRLYKLIDNLCKMKNNNIICFNYKAEYTDMSLINKIFFWLLSRNHKVKPLSGRLFIVNRRKAKI